MRGRGPAVDLSIRVGSIVLPNPILTASGTAGYGHELADHLDLASLGAVVVKSLHAEPWEGNPAPRVHATPAGMLNSVGLQGPGVEAWLAHDLPALAATGARVVASIWGRTVDEFARAAELLADAPPEVVAVEVNASCPNLEDRRALFAHSAVATAAVVAAATRPDCAGRIYEVCGPRVYSFKELLELMLAEIHRRVIAAGGPILVFRNVRGCDFPVVTNLFGSAARVYWTFKALGHDEVAILNGGVAGWQAQGFEVASGTPEAIAAGDFAGHLQDDLLATTAEVEAAHKKGNPEIDYTWVDWMGNLTVSEKKIRQFLKQGGLIQ